MQLPRLKMTSQPGLIGIKHNEAQQMIRQPKAELHIEQRKADMVMTTKQARLNIDQTKAWAETHLMSTRQFIEHHARLSKSDLADGIRRRVEEGDALMKIEKQGHPIAEQAEVNGFRQQKRLSLKYIPSPLSVKIDVDPAELHIDVQTNRPIIHAEPRQPEHDYIPGSVDIYMLQYPEIHIEVVEPTISMHI